MPLLIANQEDRFSHVKAHMRVYVNQNFAKDNILQGSHRLEKYLNLQDCLEKSLKIKFALKST